MLARFAIALPLTFAFTTATNAVSYNAANFEDDSTTWYDSLEQFTLLAVIGQNPSITLPDADNVSDASVGRRLKAASSSGGYAVYPSEYASIFFERPSCVLCPS